MMSLMKSSSIKIYCSSFILILDTWGMFVVLCNTYGLNYVRALLFLNVATVTSHFHLSCFSIFLKVFLLIRSD